MIRPLHDNIVLRKENVEKKTASGIILSGDSKEQPMIATVLAVGPGRMVDGALDVPALKVGDKVVYKKYSATDIKIDSEEVLVLGGGAALVAVYRRLKGILKDDVVDVQKGINVVLESLLAPVRQIAENAGYDAIEILERQNQETGFVGFDAKKGVWGDMFEAGIVDPTKVTRSALQNATSISALFITTEAGVAERKEPKPQTPPMPDLY